MPTMSRKDRLRRVVLLCCSFARNLAYYRVGQSEYGKRLLAPSHPLASFWRQTNSNCLDVCVLEWCKLLGDKKGEHYWSRTVSDPTGFESGLLARIGMNSSAFQAEGKAMRQYRDKFVAHLDSDAVMRIPTLKTAQTSVWFYHEVVVGEAVRQELSGLADTVK